MAFPNAHNDWDNDTDYDSSSSWYYYDYNYTNYTENHVVAAFFTIYTISFLVGLIGNLLVIFAVVRSRRLHNVTCLFLANLAVADLLTVVFSIPLKIAVTFIGYWSLGDFVCRTVAYLNVVSPMCSIFTMTIISLERYYVVLYPLQAKSFVTMGRAKRVVAGLWIVSCVVSVPAIFSKKETKHYDELDNFASATCNDGWPSKTWVQIYAVYLFLLLFLFPLCIVSNAYMMLACQLCTTGRRNIRERNGSPFSRGGESRYRVWYRNTSGWSSGSSFVRRGESTQINGNTEDGISEASALRNREGSVEVTESPAPRRHRRRGDSDKIQRVVTMLAIVVALFIFSWGPLLTFSLLIRFDIVTTADLNIPSLVLNYIAACNSCINPIIYAFLSKNFRQSFKQVIRECYHGKRHRQLAYQPSLRGTRASRTSYTYVPPGSLQCSPRRTSSQKAQV